MTPFVLSFRTSHYGEITTLGDFISKARLEKGLTQTELAGHDPETTQTHQGRYVAKSRGVDKSLPRTYYHPIMAPKVFSLDCTSAPSRADGRD